MANYQHKRSSVAGKTPLAGDLLEGEIAVNIKDRKLFAKDDQGTVFEFLGGNSGGVDTVNGVAPVAGNVTLNALNIPPTADRLWLTQAERQLIAGFDAYDKVESDDRYLLESNNLSDLTNVTTARTNLGVGTAATRDVGEVAGNVMEVGAFGLGSGEGAVAVSDFDTILTNSVGATIFIRSTYKPDNSPTIGYNYFAGVFRSIYTGYYVYEVRAAAPQDSSFTWRRYYSGGTWGNWVREYGSENIVGTVSQSGGVPTGAIIERGSNANGRYWKMAGGQLICDNRNNTITTNPVTFVGDVTSIDGDKLRVGMWF